MIRKRKGLAKASITFALLMLAGSPVLASDVIFNGFASFVIGQAIDEDELPEDGFRGFDEDLNFQNNSLFALQMRADLKDNLAAVTQVIAKGSNDYDAQFNWAYLTYDLNSKWTVKLGRQRVPYFIYSDFLDVGYSYHWISPPDYVYDMGGFDSGDGVVLEQQTDIGSWFSRLTLLAGGANTNVTFRGDTLQFKVKNQLFASWAMTHDWLTLRATYAKLTLTIPIDTFVDEIYSQLQAGGIVLSDASRSEFLAEDESAYFAGVGLSIDPGNMFVIAEYTKNSIKDTMFPDDSTQWYMSFGYRMDSLTFYGTIEHKESDFNDEGVNQVVANDITPLPIPDGTKALMAGAIQGIFDSTTDDADAFNLGIRYAFHPSATLKIQYTQEDNAKTDKEPQAIALAVDLIY